MLRTLQQAWHRLFANTSGTTNPQDWFVEWIRATPSDSGVAVDAKSAIGYAPIWNGINKIAGHVGIMPLKLKQEIEPRNKVNATRHPSYFLLHDEPNIQMEAMVFKELLQFHAILWGNGRAYIERNARTEPIGLIPLPPETISVRMFTESRGTRPTLGQKVHTYRDAETNELVVIPDKDVFHLAGLGYDGLQGYSLVDVARNSIGLGLASEKHINRHFKANGVPSLVIEAPRGAFRDKKDAQEFLDKWNAYHGGLDNSQKTALMRDGMKAHVLTMPGRDAQWIEQRKFQRQEAALWLLLESILGDDSSVSYNSLEQKNLAYLTNCLLRWLRKWEGEAGRKLLTRAQYRSGQWAFKFTTAALLRGTTKERYEVYQIGRQIGVLSANDVRELEDMPPIEGGDDYSNPAITPGAPEEDEAPESDEAETDGDAAARLQSLLRYECDRVCEAAARPGNFVKWLDNFYQAHMATVIGVYLAISDADAAELARDHVQQSKDAILEIAGRSTGETLLDNLQSVLNQWPTTRSATQQKEMVAA